MRIINAMAAEVEMHQQFQVLMIMEFEEERKVVIDQHLEFY
jgi:hypothetical protein